jgi:parallel beta-helix repeat protein
MYSHNNTITNNELSGNSLGINVVLSDYNRVDNNSVRMNGHFAITIGRSNHSVVAHNLFYWFGERGLFIQDTVGTILLKNTVSSGRDRGYGISLNGNQETAVIGNVLTSNYAAVQGWDNENITYSENIQYDGFAGLGCARCHNVTVVNNTLVRNIWVGLGFGMSTHVSIIGNFVGWNHQAGIVFGFTGPPSEDCIVYHNTFMENTVQAFSNSSDIRWNDDYPGIDLESGPNQDQPGSDGIGDSPYFSIEGVFSVDHYPLMDPSVQVPTEPSAPPNLAAVGGNKQVTLTWLPPASDGGSPITSYNVYRGNSSGGESFLVEVWNELTYVDRDVLPGQTYYYRVSANNAFGEGPLSNEESAVPFSLPAKPEVYDAVLSGENWENVTLMWIPSKDDGGGDMSVVGYRIYRNTKFDRDGLGYVLIATTPNGTSEYTDPLAGEGDPNNYFYRVCAVDASNNYTCADRQAGKFIRPLLRGPNLVSIPLTQSNESIEAVFRTISFYEAWTYEAVWNKWISYMAFKPYKGELRTINNKMGVWVNVTEESNLTVAGIVPMATTVQLRAGWNLLSFPSFDQAYNAGDLKAETGATRVEGFQMSAPPYYLRELTDGDTVQTGYGFWVWVKSDITWTVRNS